MKQHSEPPHRKFAQRLVLLLANGGYPTDAVSVQQALLRSNPRLRITLLTVKNWLAGRTMPRAHSLEALADWLKVPQSMLVFGEQEPQLLEVQLSQMDLTIEATRLLQGFMALNSHHRRSVAEVVKALNCLQARDVPLSPQTPPSSAKRGDRSPKRVGSGP